VKRALGSSILFCVVVGAAIGLCSPNLVAAGKDDVLATAPLGMESLLPRPHGQAFAIYASVEGIELSQLQPTATKSASARPKLQSLPSTLSFRVTATTMGIGNVDTAQAASFEAGIETAKLMAGLQFRLRVAPGGLHVERLEPADVRMIGVPADVPYGERIYRVTFHSEPLPPTARLVLEVSAPNGELLCKFPLE
jgi:hypothetical protein